jgi:hypothetical protein
MTGPPWPAPPHWCGYPGCRLTSDCQTTCEIETARASLRAAQRADWKQRLNALHAAQRRGRARRKPPEPSGYRIPPPGGAA